MAKYCCAGTQVELPPAQHWQTSLLGLSNSEETHTLIAKLKEATLMLSGAVCGHEFTPMKLDALAYVDLPIRELRSLKFGWNHRNGEPFPPRLLDLVERAWDCIKETVPVSQMPTVIPGDEMVALCWSRPGERLEIVFSFDEDQNDYVFDWVMETKKAGKKFGESLKFDQTKFTQQVREFAAA